MAARQPRRASRGDLDALARANRMLGRLKCEPLVTVDEARDMPEYQVREWIVASQEHIVYVRHALRGIVG